jgi:NTP pyrophosphatase (non-canonical NTP hydrolase)
MLDFGRLQDEVNEWSLRNFGPKNPATTHRTLLGVMEEVGELAHARLKEEQGIRGTPEEHQAAATDAIGDIVIYLADFCNACGYDFQAIMDNTWDTVKLRNWKKDPVKGVAG